jgi:tetratricopeptide (TPR) repeat protein
MSGQVREHLTQDSLLEASPSPLASRAAEAMRLGDFKHAIDLFRRLVKQDGRKEWRDALAEAYAGRARILAAKGMFEEAEIAGNFGDHTRRMRTSTGPLWTANSAAAGQK